MSITVGIATIPERANELEQTSNSLDSQADDVIICKSERGCYPGDAGKFYGIRTVEDGYYFTCDDDLIYPPDYVEKMVAKLQEYDNKIVVSCHGRTFANLPGQHITSYYKSKARKLRCLDKVASDEFVQIGGTGCMAFHTSLIKPKLTDFKNGYMADLWFAKLCQENKIPILVMKHEKEWIKYQAVKWTIYDEYRENDKVQTDLVNSIDWEIFVKNK